MAEAEEKAFAQVASPTVEVVIPKVQVVADSSEEKVYNANCNSTDDDSCLSNVMHFIAVCLSDIL